MTCHFFVYGTLKRGLKYEHVWPSEPLSVQAAWVRGVLFDGPSYPAMKPGGDRVLGELWSFDASQCDLVTRSLDALEGTNSNSPDDLYHRFVTEAFDRQGARLGDANVYHFVRDPLQNGFVQMSPRSDNYVAWPAAS
jgi:gamma-glutamylcyclotransferase (GGCT)/AIG2-like uncharacterized protein YtfP